MPGWLKNFLSFNTTERTGIFILLGLILIAVLLPLAFRHLTRPAEVDISAFRQDIQDFEKGLAADSAEFVKKADIDFEHIDRSIASRQIKPFPFNPNEIDAGQWKLLGLKDWQVKIVMKYRSKGGRFLKKEDLSKIYGITQAEFDLLQPYIQLPEIAEKPAVAYAKPDKPVYKTTIVDLNTADSETLLELKGIGPSFARRILKYRERLGGFYSATQLMEVYGFDQQRFDQVAPYCLVGNGPYKKINLNTITTAELKKHPYMDFYSAKAIVDRRISKGKYSSVEQIRELPLIYGDLYEKIKNYFSIE